MIAIYLYQILIWMYSRQLNEIENSDIRTQHSFIDNVSSKVLKDDFNYNIKIEEFKNVLKWIQRRAASCQLHNMDIIKQGVNYSFYMIKISSIHNLTFKKCYKDSKVNIKLIGKLVNTKTNRQYPKICQFVKVLGQINLYLYELAQEVCFYFYSSCESELLFKIQILLCQYEINGEGTISSFGHIQNAGYIEIEVARQTKKKQKKNIILPNQFSIFNRQINDINNTNIFATYQIFKSQAYRNLQKIISENILCDPKDKISGIVGYYLPINQNSLTDFAITPDAQGLHLDFTDIQINQHMLKESVSKAQELVHHKYSCATKVAKNVGDLIMKVKFHNGWKTVSFGQSILKQKGQLPLKTNNSAFSQLNNKRIKSNASIHAKNKFINKRFQCENAIQLKLIFPQQEQCVLIFQIYSKVSIKAQIPNKSPKEPFQLINDSFLIPVCFGIVSAKSLGDYKLTNCVFNPGTCLNSLQNLKQMVQKNLKNIQLLNQINISKTNIIIQKTKTPSLINQFDNLSINNNIRTSENISQQNIKNYISQFGYVEFEMRMMKAENLGLNVSGIYNMENKSSLNISKIDIKDKIMNQKQRITKQTKKNTEQIKSKKLALQFLNTVYIPQNLKNTMSNKPSEKRNIIKSKQQFLQNLKQQMNSCGISNLCSLDHRDKGSSKIQTERIKQSVNIFHSIRLNTQQSNLPIAHEKSPWIHYLLRSNYQISQNDLFKYQNMSIQTIKTQLTQINYNNCFFINFINITNHIDNQPVKVPKIFFFVFRLFNQPEVRSQLMTINKDTGQILLAFDEQSTNKIMHVEVDINSQTDNYALNFINFINFMNNGLLNIEMINFNTGLTFSQFSIPLRNLIRKRKNEIIHIHDDYLYYNNFIRGRIKMEIRSIRKMKQPIKVNQKQEKISMQSNTSIIEKQIQAVEKIKDNSSQSDRILERINKYKFNKNNGKFGTIQQQNQLNARNIAQGFHKAFIHETITIEVQYLKKQFFFIEVINKSQQKLFYRFSINDEDRKWTSSNPLCVDDEIYIVKDPNLIEKEDHQLLNLVKKYQEKLLKCFRSNEEEIIQLPPRAKGYLLLCYLTVRKYKQWGDQLLPNNQLTIYNRQRIITISLINDITGNIQTIYEVQIIPTPQSQIIEKQYYRPANEQSIIHIPFIDPQCLENGIDQILIDDPYIIVTSGNHLAEQTIKNMINTYKPGVYLQISNDIQPQKCKQINVLILNDLKKKKRLLAESRKNYKIKNKGKTNSRMSLEETEQHICGPSTLNIKLKVWGCEKITSKGDLWIQKEGVIQIYKRNFKEVKDLTYFYLVSDKQQVFKLSKTSTKSKQEGIQLYKFNQNQKTLFINYTIFPQQIGHSYIQINIIDLNQAISQQELFHKKQFKQLEPIYRMVIQLETIVPSFKQIIKINVNKASQQVILEQLFNYKSSCSKKTQFRIFSNDPILVWVNSHDCLFQLESKAEKKININFNLQTIAKRGLFTGFCDAVIVGIKWDRGIDYFAFKFNIY